MSFVCNICVQVFFLAISNLFTQIRSTYSQPLANKLFISFRTMGSAKNTTQKTFTGPGCLPLIINFTPVVAFTQLNRLKTC